MASTSSRTIPCSHLSFRTFPVPMVRSRPRSRRVFVGPTRPKETTIRLGSSRTNNHRPSVCLSPASSTFPCCVSASERLALLVSEFRSLSEPLDRVKLLLHYAAILPEFEESARVDTNRVTGCTTQVWLDVGLEDSSSSCTGGRIRFRADSDSEITKGFCSCLIWVLDGAAPEEVLAVQADELGPMNVGVVAHSRVNTWHNVLIGMQRRTKRLLVTDEQMHNGNGVNSAESQVH